MSTHWASLFLTLLTQALAPTQKAEGRLRTLTSTSCWARPHARTGTDSLNCPTSPHKPEDGMLCPFYRCANRLSLASHLLPPAQLPQPQLGMSGVPQPGDTKDVMEALCKHKGWGSNPSSSTC